jgi:hypothetical protein
MSLSFLLWIWIFINVVGDVQPNPGPAYTSGISSDYGTSSNNMSSLLNLPNQFFVVHYNVQSIIHKLDLLSYELQSFDVLCFTETWLSDSHHSDDLNFRCFHPIVRRDRENDNHGNDLEPVDIECL